MSELDRLKRERANYHRRKASKQRNVDWEGVVTTDKFMEHTDLARLKSERDELREALVLLLSWTEAKCHNVCFAHDAVSRCVVCEFGDKARAVLKRTEGK